MLKERKSEDNSGSYWWLVLLYAVVFLGLAIYIPSYVGTGNFHALDWAVEALLIVGFVASLIYLVRILRMR